MKKYWFVILLTLFAASSCQEDITEEVPLNDHSTPPPGDGDDNDDDGDADGDGDKDDGVDIKIGQDNSNAMLGNPTDAKHDVADPDNYLMDKGFYVLSYNKTKAIPNWVSWYVGPNSVGPAKRSDDFTADGDLPAGWFRVSDGSYTGSGFSRGHNCPSADRTSSDAANHATFLMTNMIPQNQINNEGVWASFEDYTRDQMKAGNEVFVVMGNYGAGGTDKDGIAKTTIAGGAITVPAHIWKVIVIISRGDGDLARINTGTRVIAIDTPNKQDISGTWGSFRVSVDAIEASTGFDLLSELPDDVENTLEANVDTKAI